MDHHEGVGHAEGLAATNNVERHMRLVIDGLVIDGLTFAEGPRWRDCELWFADLQRWQADQLLFHYGHRRNGDGAARPDRAAPPVATG
jgi:hypothetical protein